MDIISCLLRYPWRTLAALAAVYDVPAHHHRPKEQIARQLSSAIRTHLPQTVAALDADARAALRALLQATDLTLPHAHFVARFGPLHPYRPWNPDAPPAPWPTPSSPAATLVHYGLVYPLNLGTASRPVPAIVLPAELRPPLSILLVPSPPPLRSSAPTLPRSSAPPLLSHLFALLSFLNREDIRPIHGRWLPPTALRRLAPFLRPQAREAEHARSELKVPYLSFLHYLAERAGLVDVAGGCLKPTAAALRWLNEPTAERIRVLWSAWTDVSATNAALWQRYRLPLSEEEDPPARFRRLCAALSGRPAGVTGDLPGLLRALAERAPSLFRPSIPYRDWAALDEETRATFRRRREEHLSALLTGPLAWFGVVQMEEDRLTLTPLGAALLGRSDGSWPADPPLFILHIHPPSPEHDEEETFLLEVREIGRQPTSQAAFTLPIRFSLEGVIPPDPQVPGHYRLTRRHLLRALQRGHTLMGILNLLEEAAGPLPPLLVGTVYRWAEEFGQVTLRQVVLLEARDPALLQELTARRRIRETLRETLSARAVRVDGSRLDALIRRLERRGVVPRLDLADQPPPSVGDLSGEDRVVIATALRLYVRLADELRLPARPPHTLAHAWGEGLTLAQRDEVERLVEEALERLRRAAPPEEPYRLPLPTGPLLEALEEAIAAGETVEIEYYTAGRGHVTRRRVEPLRLEWRGEVVYLIAYCHLRKDQRVFRVDRIADVKRET